MADNLIDVPDDNLANVPDTNLVDVPETPTMRERQRAFNAQIRMGAPEQAAQMSAGETNIVAPTPAIPPQPETSPSLERDEQGNMVIVNKPYAPVGDTRKGIFKRMTESASAAFGNEPPGISPENLKKYPYLNVLQPFAGMADIALRDINSAVAGGAGAVAGLAENLGMSEAEASRLQRDIYQGMQIAGTQVPTPTVGMMTKPVVRKGPPSPPSVETINFMTGKPPVEPPPQLPIISYAEGAIVPEVRSKGARLLPSETPHEPIALPPRAGVGAEAAVGPLDGVSPEAINQVARDLKEAHFTPYTLDDRLEKMSPHQFFAEAAENLETEAGKIASMGGESRNIIKQNVDQRHSEVKQRLKSSYDSAFGPVENLAQERKTLTIDQKAAADKFYKKFRDLEIHPTDELKEIIPRLEAAGAFGEAKKIAAVEGFPWEESFFTTGTRKNYPTAESWDYVKRALDTKIEGSFNQFGEPTNWTRIYTNLKNKLVGAIDNHPNPEVAGVWKEARDTYAGPATIKNAYEFGKKILSDAVDFNEVPFLTASHSTKELEAIAKGIRYNLENQLGKAGPQEGRSIRQIISDNAQNKIRWIIDEKAEKLFNSIDLENQMYGAPTRLIGGSPTAKRVLGTVEKYGPKPPRGAETLGTIVETGVGLLKEPKKTITKTASKFVTEKMARTAEEKAAKLRADIAHIYTLQGPERDVAIRWILEHGEGFKGTPTRATGGSVFDKMHAAKHMQQGGGLSSFLEGEYSGNKEGQHGGGYLGIESPTGNAGIGGQGWRENTPEGRLGRASITNVDVGHKIGDLNLTGSYRANQREIARPPAGDNTYFDPIEHSGQKFRMPNDIDKRFMLGLSKQFSDGGSVFDKMHAAKHMQQGGGLESFIKSLGSQGAAFGTQTEQEQAGFQRDPISELGKGAYNAVEHLAKENIDNANLLATGNRDQFSGKPGFEAGMLTMGTGAVAGVPMRAGEFALGSGPIKSDPKLWHGISKIKLPKPISEMNATRSPIAEIAEKQIVPSDLQGGLLLPAIGDRSIANANLHGFNGYKFEEPVPMQGGHGFMAANADKDVAWASGSPVIGRIASDVRKLNESGNPIYFPYTAMGERSVDFSHHISSTLAEALKQQPLTRNAERQFNAAMKSDAGSFGAVKNWPGVNSPYLKDYLLSSKGDVRNKFAKLMDTNNFQSLGFPNVAEARFAVTDPRLLNAPTGAAGISVSKLDPSGKILKDVSGHLTYDTDLGGKYVGGLGRSIPKEVFYPDLLSAYKKLNYEPFQYDYLMSRGVTGAPRAQKANQKWVDNVSKWIEKNPKEETKFNSGGSVFDKMKRASK